jgi:hypothetical protein
MANNRTYFNNLKAIWWIKFVQSNHICWIFIWLSIDVYCTYETRSRLSCMCKQKIRQRSRTTITRKTVVVLDTKINWYLQWLFQRIFIGNYSTWKKNQWRICLVFFDTLSHGINIKYTKYLLMNMFTYSHGNTSASSIVYASRRSLAYQWAQLVLQLTARAQSLTNVLTDFSRWRKSVKIVDKVNEEIRKLHRLRMLNNTEQMRLLMKTMFACFRLLFSSRVVETKRTNNTVTSQTENQSQQAIHSSTSRTRAARGNSSQSLSEFKCCARTFVQCLATDMHRRLWIEKYCIRFR